MITLTKAPSFTSLNFDFLGWIIRQNCLILMLVATQ
uniref:Uncharacterized protein n=1 Tax=Rhizophora mucronata TaxID=61149 RepID=A0A2P2Q3Z0_RHIMU